MSDVDLIFEDPPPQMRGRRGRSAYGPFLAALREHPGQWAKYPERSWTSAASHIHHGKTSGCEAGEFETTCRNIAKDGRCDMYARYIGTPNGRAS